MGDENDKVEVLSGDNRGTDGDFEEEQFKESDSKSGEDKQEKEDQTSVNGEQTNQDGKTEREEGEHERDPRDGEQWESRKLRSRDRESERRGEDRRDEGRRERGEDRRDDDRRSDGRRGEQGREYKSNAQPSRCVGIFGIGNLDQEMIKRTLSEYGPLERFDVITNSATGVSKGYAFAYFRDLEDAIKVVNEHNGKGMLFGTVRARLDYSRTNGETPRRFGGRRGGREFSDRDRPRVGGRRGRDFRSDRGFGRGRDRYVDRGSYRGSYGDRGSYREKERGSYRERERYGDRYDRRDRVEYGDRDSYRGRVSSEYQRGGGYYGNGEIEGRSGRGGRYEGRDYGSRGDGYAGGRTAPPRSSGGNYRGEREYFDQYYGDVPSGSMSRRRSPDRGSRSEQWGPGAPPPVSGSSSASQTRGPAEHPRGRSRDSYAPRTQYSDGQHALAPPPLPHGGDEERYGASTSAGNRDRSFRY